MFKNLSRQALLLFPVLILMQAVIKNNFKPMPDYNWDLLPYMSLVLKIDGMKDDSLRHQKVYEIAKNQIPWDQFHDLISEKSPYRHDLYHDYKGFAEQLPLYKIKPVYIGLVYLLYKSGISLVKATYLPSIISFYLIGFLLFFFLSQRIQPLLALITTLMVTLLPATLTVSTLSTPDALSALFTLMAFLILLNNQNSRWILPLFVLVILTRRDMVLFVGLLSVGLVISSIFKKEFVKQRVTDLALLCLTFFLSSFWLNSPSWKDTFVQSFVFRKVYFLSEEHIFLWKDYWDILDRLYIHLSNPFVTLILIGFPVFFMKKKRIKFIYKLSLNQFIFLCIFGINIFRFFLFPDIHDRFYYIYYCIMLVMLVNELTNKGISENHSIS